MSKGGAAVNDAEWNALVDRWLRLAAKSLCSYAIETSAGERGVLLVELDLDEMRSIFDAASRPNVRIRFETTPTWVPVDSFLEYVRAGHPDPAFYGRVKPQLESMDPAKHVAVELRSDVGKESVLTRFLVIDSHLVG